MVAKIESFHGLNRFLSNCYPAPVTLGGMQFGCVECAYQAAKTLDIKMREQFITAPPNTAKRMGQRLVLRPHWDRIKLAIMHQLVFEKFHSNPSMRDRLIGTENALLIEGNDWGDTYWGVCRGLGANNLGNILMLVRSEIFLRTDKDRT